MRNDKGDPILVRKRQARTRQPRDFDKLHSRSLSQRSKGMQRYRGFCWEDSQSDILFNTQVFSFAMEFPPIFTDKIHT